MNKTIDFNGKQVRNLYCPGTLCLRAKQEGEGESRTITGYAIRFNEDSVKMYDYFIERIAPSCVTDDTLKESDIKMTLFHNREKLLARSNMGEGSLRLFVDEKGVGFEFEAPETEIGDFALEGIKRGDLSGCSFTFIPGDYMTETEDDGSGNETLRVTHTRFEELLEMTIGTDPAYPTTSVGMREQAANDSFYQELRREAQPSEDELRKLREADDERVRKEHEKVMRRFMLEEN
ncbi:MAG: HK97 family phage prohead protease [Prevotellaceae bacterium]|nr:HK97 family phage prohead protease [Prevotellaceae bacterium]